MAKTMLKTSSLAIRKNLQCQPECVLRSKSVAESMKLFKKIWKSKLLFFLFIMSC